MKRLLPFLVMLLGLLLPLSPMAGFAAGETAPTPANPADTVPELPTVPGTYAQSLTSGGITRTYLLYIPPTYTAAKKVPLVIFLHGGGGKSAQTYMERVGLNRKADQEGFLVVYPDSAAAGKRGWSAHMNSDADDIRFLRELIQSLEHTLAVDPRRVFVTGFSSGALLAYRAGTALADQISALGIVAGSFVWNLRLGQPTPPPTPARPLSVIIIHGKQDKNVPYEGFDNGRALGWSASKSVAFWVRHDGCGAPPETETSADGNVIRESYTGGREHTRVIFYTVVNGAHSWPTRAKGGLATNDVLWDFFKSSRP